MNELFEILEKELPLMVPRKEFTQLVGIHFGGSCLTTKSMTSLDYKGEGPKAMRIGKKTFYPKNELISWLRSKMN